MYLQIKKAELVPDKYGKKIEITMVGLYENTGRWIKRVKLEEFLLKTLLEQQIEVI